MKPTVVQKIFVNRSIQMSKIKCIGFDMDATLASKFCGQERLAWGQTYRKERQVR